LLQKPPILLAVHSELPIGTIEVKPVDHYALLGLFAVDPDYQSMRIGSTLVQAAEEFAVKELSVYETRVWVISVRDSIISWYKRLGYVDTGEELPFAMPDKAKIPNLKFIVLSKQLSAE